MVYACTWVLGWVGTYSRSEVFGDRGLVATLIARGEGREEKEKKYPEWAPSSMRYARTDENKIECK